MTNIYNTVVLKDEDDFDFESFLKRVDAWEVFEPLFEKYGANALAVRVLKFIVLAYTPESEFLSEDGGSWEDMAKNIGNYVDLPTDCYDDVYRLKCPVVQKCIQEYLFWQNSEAWVNYCTFRDLRKQMIAHSLSEVKKGEELDIKSKMDAAKNAKELLEMMDATKNSFVQERAVLKEAVKAFKAVAPAKAKETLGPQTFAR